MAEEMAPWDDEETPAMEAPSMGVPQQEPQQQGGIGETIVDTAMSVGRGFNPFVNTIGAAIMSAMDDGMSYKQAKEWYDKDTARRQKRTPVGSIAGEIGGAMLLPMPGTTTLKLAQGSGKLAKFLGVTKVAAKNGLLHGAFGAAYGAADGDTAEERVQNALFGGAFGS